VKQVSIPRCGEFQKTCQHKLGQVAKKFGIPPGLFLLSEFAPIKFEQRAGMLHTRGAQKSRTEEGEELVKIFVDGEDEPRSSSKRT